MWVAVTVLAVVLVMLVVSMAVVCRRLSALEVLCTCQKDILEQQQKRITELIVQIGVMDEHHRDVVVALSRAMGREVPGCPDG